MLMQIRWHRRKQPTVVEQRDPPDDRGKDPPVVGVRERRPPLHPSKRSWTFDEDPAVINRVPTAKSFRSEDSEAQFQEIKTGHSRYSVDAEETQTVLAEKLETATTKEDKYLQGAKGITIWSDDSDDQAKWRSRSGDTTSPRRDGPSPVRSRLSPIKGFSPRWLKRDPSTKAQVANLSPLSESSARAAHLSNSNRDKRKPASRGASPEISNAGDTRRNPASTAGSQRSNASRSRKERAPKPEDVQTRGRIGRGRSKSTKQQPAPENNIKASSRRVKNEKKRGDSEENSDRSRNSRKSKGSRSNKTQSSDSDAGIILKKSSSSSAKLKSDDRSKHSKTPKQPSKKSETPASNKQIAAEMQRIEITEDNNYKDDRPNPKTAVHTGPSIFDTITSFNESELHPSRLTTVQTARTPLDATNPGPGSPPEIYASVEVAAEPKLYQPMPIRYNEVSDNSTISLLRKDVLILKTDQPSRDRDPPTDADPELKRFDPPTGKSWTSTDVASSLTGSLPLANSKERASAYSAFLAVPEKIDPTTALRKEECDESLERLINNVKNDNPNLAGEFDSSFPKHRVRSGVIHPPSMKGMDPPSRFNPVEYPVEFASVRSNNIRAQPVVTNSLVDRDENDENGEYSFRQSLIELCEPVTNYLMEGMRAVRNIDNGSCDEPFTFLDCKALECDNEESDRAKSAAPPPPESGLHVLEAKSMKLDDETPVDEQQKEVGKLESQENPKAEQGLEDILKQINGLPFSTIEIPTPKSFIIDDDSYSRSILGLEKLPMPPSSSPKSRVRPPTPPRGRKSHHQQHHDGRDSRHHSADERPHKRSHSSKDRASRSKSEEKRKKSRSKSHERVRFTIPEPTTNQPSQKTKKRGFLGNLFRRGR